MTKVARLGKLVPLDDDAAYAAVYDDTEPTTPPRDQSARYAAAVAALSDDALYRAERWARYYVESGVRRSEVHRLRAIHDEQQRRRTR